MSRVPGEVFFLPPDDVKGGDPENRRHVLLTHCDEGYDTATVCFASKKDTEASYRAPHLLLDPHATHYNRTGFKIPTYIYPSRLISLDGDYVMGLEMEGKIIDEMPDIRMKLAEALGIGTGSTTGSGAAAGSLRGKILEFIPDVANAVDATRGVAVCHPGYSRFRRYVNVLPMFDGADYEALDSDLFLIDDTADEEGFDENEAFIVGASMIFSVFYPEQVLREIDTVTDAAMAEIDIALQMHFGLP